MSNLCSHSRRGKSLARGPGPAGRQSTQHCEKLSVRDETLQPERALPHGTLLRSHLRSATWYHSGAHSPARWRRPLPRRPSCSASPGAWSAGASAWTTARRRSAACLTGLPRRRRRQTQIPTGPLPPRPRGSSRGDDRVRSVRRDHGARRAGAPLVSGELADGAAVADRVLYLFSCFSRTCFSRTANAGR